MNLSPFPLSSAGIPSSLFPGLQDQHRLMGEGCKTILQQLVSVETAHMEEGTVLPLLSFQCKPAWVLVRMGPITNVGRNSWAGENL